MPQSQRTITLTISDEEKSCLEQIAIERQILRKGKPNISALMRRIARRELPLGTPIPEDTQAIFVRLLKDANPIEAKKLAEFLLSQGGFDTYHQEYLQHFLSTYKYKWINDVMGFIEQHQPFELFYEDASRKGWVFHCRWAELWQREKHTYLVCWCDETEGNQDLLGLQHNWCFRLDRIHRIAGVIPCEGEWREAGLDSILATFHLLGGLAHAYEPRTEDISSEWIASNPPTRKISRRISSTFWFIRAILPYGKDCQVVCPPEICDRIRDQLKAALEGYPSA